MTRPELIDAYLDGPRLLREAIAGMSPTDLAARPVPGKWSTKEVVCHVADAEPVYAERIKRALVEDRPPLRAMDPDVWVAGLAYDARDVEEELRLIEAVRGQLARILRTLPDEAWSRVGIHSEAGPLSVEDLVRRVTGHITHHLPFIAEKRKALGR